MKLNHLLHNLNYETFSDDLSTNIDGLSIDSRDIQKNYLFIAIKGTSLDGHEFIDKAIEKGAIAVIHDSIIDIEKYDKQVIFIKVKNSADVLGRVASNFYDNPSIKLKLVGITGTNGKTTTATLLYQLFLNLGYKVGLISTVENRIHDKIIPSTHTTPNAIHLQRLLNEMVEKGCDFAFMEVSSHAIDQNRIADVHFTGAVFTNITHDHLDYHKTFDNYLHAKKNFFDNLSKEAFALVNKDDRNSSFMLQNTKAKKYSYSILNTSNFKAKILENTIDGLHLDLDGFDFYGKMIGEFNAYNLVCVYACSYLLGVKKDEILTTLSKLNGAEGRFDYIKTDDNIVGIVDYAHTPDAIEKVLTTINTLKSSNSKVITVVGCGGDRDKAKRPVMTKISCEFSDVVVVTSDNPRTENPSAIIEDMLEGLSPTFKNKIIVNENRLHAIQTACKLASKDDFILIAGKGHEKYQEVNGVKTPFDDKKILHDILKKE
ncbi:MAG: UDP-N-acetylmuramoyl-L-alanyl-D-glutamate--2,6-diaminopimelate ligase [Saprospiraceae bacterium]|nr:UDP-N-acetylmuramoyl-L-alanyl-D-glutamate--2,6-diaminopimelate ligase [Saprospiraceae bacterium]